MKRKTTIMLAGLLIMSVLIAGFVIANGNDGPAPNSGDGISDGSGFDSQNGPNGNDNSVYGNDGPAPNSSDGISDGSGWELL
jgi:hypothetical protein